MTFFERGLVNILIPTLLVPLLSILIIVSASFCLLAFTKKVYEECLFLLVYVASSTNSYRLPGAPPSK